jgi:ABC-type amino acid transport substrate-binding protein
VSIDDEGLEIFPTHRVTGGAVPELDGRFRQTPLAEAGQAAAALAGVARDHPAFVLLRRDGAALVEGDEQALDTALVDSLPLADVEYTASAAEAEQAVSSGQATAAFLVRPPTVQQVEEFARAGVRMPPKSTYFFPKLTSGLLLSPFDE